jgi:hypothetical protein
MVPYKAMLPVCSLYQISKQHLEKCKRGRRSFKKHGSNYGCNNLTYVVECSTADIYIYTSEN